MARERIPNFVARKSKWTAVFRSGGKWFWPLTIILIALVLLHVNAFAHPFKFIDGGHTVYKVAAVDATCTEEGNEEYYVCAKCDKLYSDSKCTKKIKPEDTVRPVAEHDLDENGICKVCLKTVSADNNGATENGENEGSSTQIGLCSGKHKVALVPAKASTCTERGNIEYYKCTSCDKLYSDAACTNEVSIKDVQLGYDHDMHKGVPLNKSRTYRDNEELYFCWTCERVFADYQGEREVFKPLTVNVGFLGMRLSIWTIALAIYTVFYLIALTWTFIIIRCQRIEFYDTYVIEKRGVIFKRSKKSIFPQITRVSTKKHFFNYGNILIDVVGPWDIDFTGIARPEDVRAYLVDHMVNAAAVEGIGNNPYIAVLGTTPDNIF